MNLTVPFIPFTLYYDVPFSDDDDDVKNENAKSLKSAEYMDSSWWWWDVFLELKFYSNVTVVYMMCWTKKLSEWNYRIWKEGYVHNLHCIGSPEEQFYDVSSLLYWKDFFCMISRFYFPQNRSVIKLLYQLHYFGLTFWGFNFYWKITTKEINSLVITASTILIIFGNWFR